MRPLLLDLFCGAGGAAMGYHRAGFDVVGVDIDPQPHYPFPFIQGDALEVGEAVLLKETCELWNGQRAILPAAVHASPPCQGYSRMRHLPWLKDNVYPLLIDPTRELLEASGLPWVIENVEDSPLERAPTLFGPHGVLLCGTMFGLPLFRHRPFESNVMMVQPEHRPHKFTIRPRRMLRDRARQPHQRLRGWADGGGGATRDGNIDAVREAFGIDWMPAKHLSQAIPPAFTEHIGRQLIEAL